MLEVCCENSWSHGGEKETSRNYTFGLMIVDISDLCCRISEFLCFVVESSTIIDFFE